MRAPNYLLISLLAGMPLCLPAHAISFQTRLEKVEWTVEGDKFECRLSQPISNFGSGEFVRRAGEQVTFRLKAREHWLGNGSATLLAAAAPWQPGRGDINLGVVSVANGEVPFNSSQEQGARLLAGLLEGRSPLVRHRTFNGGDRLEVRLLPVKFHKAYEDYEACTAKLLPVNFDQIRLAQIGFPGGGIDLDPMAKAKLDIILEFVKADPTINSFQIDGHADNSGNRLTNRDLSRRRAWRCRNTSRLTVFLSSRSPCASMANAIHWYRTPARPIARRIAGRPCVWIVCRQPRYRSRARPLRRRPIRPAASRPEALWRRFVNSVCRAPVN